MRELTVRLLGLGQISRSLNALERLEQVRRQIRVSGADAEAFDETVAFDDCPARLPERTTALRAGHGFTARCA